MTLGAAEAAEFRLAHTPPCYDAGDDNLRVFARPSKDSLTLPLDPSAVYDLATDLLDSVVARMNAELDVQLPPRQYVHAGLVAADCEQVVVAVPEPGLAHSFPGFTASSGAGADVLVCSPPRHVTLEVWVWRCVPVTQDNGDSPTTTDLDAAAQVTLADLWTLAYILWLYRDDWKGVCASLLLGPVEVVGPEGGYTAVKATVFLLVT